MGCVYIASNKLDRMKGYVGKTVLTLEERKRRHEYAAEKGRGEYFHAAIRKYGKEAFEWEVLFESDDAVLLSVAEETCIVELGTKVPNGYNLTDGGEGIAGYQHSEEAKKKISEATRGANNPSFGKQHTEESKRKMSEAMVGRKFSEEHRKKLSDAKKGKKRRTRLTQLQQRIDDLEAKLKGEDHE